MKRGDVVRLRKDMAGDLPKSWVGKKFTLIQKYQDAPYDSWLTQSLFHAVPCDVELWEDEIEVVG